MCAEAATVLLGFKRKTVSCFSDFKQWSHLLAAVYQSVKRDFLGIMPSNVVIQSYIFLNKWVSLSLKTSDWWDHIRRNKFSMTVDCLHQLYACRPLAIKLTIIQLKDHRAYLSCLLCTTLFTKRSRLFSTFVSLAPSTGERYSRCLSA